MQITSPTIYVYGSLTRKLEPFVLPAKKTGRTKQKAKKTKFELALRNRNKGYWN